MCQCHNLGQWRLQRKFLQCKIWWFLFNYHFIFARWNCFISQQFESWSILPTKSSKHTMWIKAVYFLGTVYNLKIIICIYIKILSFSHFSTFKQLHYNTMYFNIFIPDCGKKIIWETEKLVCLSWIWLECQIVKSQFETKCPNWNDTIH